MFYFVKSHLLKNPSACNRNKLDVCSLLKKYTLLDRDRYDSGKKNLVFDKKFVVKFVVLIELWFACHRQCHFYRPVY